MSAVMNPKPSLIQCLVLHHIADDDVWFDVVTGKWHCMFTRGDVTVQVDILHRDGYICISADPVPQLGILPIGKQVLDRRPLAELVEKLNSR
jgi:hypothetical protein